MCLCNTSPMQIRNRRSPFLNHERVFGTKVVQYSNHCRRQLKSAAFQSGGRDKDKERCLHQKRKEKSENGCRHSPKTCFRRKSLEKFIFKRLSSGRNTDPQYSNQTQPMSLLLQTLTKIKQKEKQRKEHINIASH